MQRREVLRGLTFVTAGILVGCQGGGEFVPLPGGLQVIRDTYPVKNGSYQVEIALQHEGSAVRMFFAKVTRHPGQDSVRVLLRECELLPGGDPLAVASALGGQPILRRVEVRPQGQRFRLEGSFWYKLGGVLVLGAGENIDLIRFIAPSEVVEVTLGDGLPATIL